MTRCAVTEAAWQQTVLDGAHACGWRSMHVRRSQGRRAGQPAWQTTTSCAGWPDLILWRPGELLAVELKSNRGTLTRDQQAVLGSLERAGVETHVWRPRDWDRVRARLARQERAP